MSLINTRVVFPAKYLAILEQQEIAESLQPDQTLIKNLYTLISSGTELALYTQSHVGFGNPKVPWAKYPYYPGYAAVGRVEAIGVAVDRMAVGDILLYLGAHQAYAVLSDADLRVKVAGDIPLAWVPYACIAHISNTARWVSQAQPGETTAVVGLGLVGHLAAQLFQIFGASTIGLDIVPFRRSVAQAVGIGLVVDPGEDVTAAIRAAAGGRGADSVVEATGNPDLIGAALRAVRPRGEVILLGSPRGQATIDVYDDIHRNGAILKGAHVGLLPRVSTEGKLDRQTVIQQMLELIRQRHLVVEPLISEIIQPSDIDRGYRVLLEEKDRTLSVLIQWA